MKRSSNPRPGRGRSGSSTSGLVASFLLAASAAGSPADGTIRFDLSNATREELLEVYVTPSKSPKWGQNLLRQGTLKAGKNATLSFSGGCGLYDVRMVAPGGKEYMDDEVSFCNENELVTVGEIEIKKVKRAPGGSK